MKENLKTNLGVINIYSFFAGVRIFVPIMFLFFKDHGMNFTQIAILSATFFGGTFIFEVPSGIFADHLGRKISILMSAILFVIGYLFLGVGNSFVFFFIGAFFSGMGEAFLSGSDEALVYDTLMQMKKETEFSKHYGTKMAFFLLGISLSSLAASIVVKWQMNYTFIISAGFAFLGLITAFFLKEPTQVKKGENLMKHIKEAITVLGKERSLKQLIIFIIGIAMSIEIFFQYIQFYLADANFSITLNGIFYALFIFMSAFGAGIASNLQNKINNRKGALFLIFALLFIPYIGLTFFKGKVIIMILIFVVEFSFGFMRPVTNHFFHKYVESHNRATVASLRSFITGVAIVIVAPILGYIADKIGYTYTTICLGGLILILSLPELLGKKEENSVLATESSSS